MIREGVIASLLACGRDVVDIGIASTPVLQHSILRLNGAGGISIGASHNTADWNALKFFGPRGNYLSTGEAGELLDIYHLRKFPFVGWRDIGKLRGASEDPGTGDLDFYIDDLARVFPLDAIRGLRVVVDCCNGTSSLILRRLNERFGLGLILINEHLEGAVFAHEPNTSSRIAGLQLAPLVIPLHADAGFLFDADSDRVAMVAEDGAPVSEEMMLPMLADHLLPRGPGKRIITNLSTTALLEEIALRRGGCVVRVPVGRQAAMDALATYRPEQIAIAGEGTGAVMMPQFRFVYDGIASMLGVLSAMRERGQSLQQILGGYPRFSILKGEIPLVTQRIPALLRDLEERYSDGKHNTTDGLRVDWAASDGKNARWFHVRVSQTEPIVRVICEQRDEPPRALFESLMELVRSYAS